MRIGIVAKKRRVKKPAAKPKPSGKVIKGTATAYGPPWGGINGEGIATACGVKINGSSDPVGAVAASPEFACGEVLAITPNPHKLPSGGHYIVWDRGGAIIGNHKIDFYIGASDDDTAAARREQLDFGSQNVSIRRIGKVKGSLSGATIDDVQRMALDFEGSTPNTGLLGKDGTVTGAFDDVAGAFDDVAGAIGAIVAFIARLFEPEFWIRVGKATLGVGAVAFGVVILGRAILGVDIPGTAGKLGRGRRERSGRSRLDREAEADAEGYEAGERSERRREGRERAKREAREKANEDWKTAQTPF